MKLELIKDLGLIQSRVTLANHLLFTLNREENLFSPFLLNIIPFSHKVNTWQKFMKKELSDYRILILWHQSVNTCIHILKGFIRKYITIAFWQVVHVFHTRYVCCKIYWQYYTQRGISYYLILASVVMSHNITQKPFPQLFCMSAPPSYNAVSANIKRSRYFQTSKFLVNPLLG